MDVRAKYVSMQLDYVFINEFKNRMKKSEGLLDGTL
jgi:hypothetical protein